MDRLRKLSALSDGARPIRGSRPTSIMATESGPEQDNKRLFEQIEAYPWDSDAEFQGGLTAILGPNLDSSPEQIQDLTLRARLFYYARKKEISPINFDAYKAYQASKLASVTDQVPPYPTSFAEIVALITAGKPIPGIREIPPTVLPDQATQPAVKQRRKPWEKEVDTSAEERSFGDPRDDVIVQEDQVEKARGSEVEK